MAHDQATHADHQPHFSSLMIFIALCICTVLSVVFDVVDLNRRLVAVLVMAVAVAKAQFVMRYFMHLKFEGRWKYVLLLPTAILACGLPLALAPDIALHYYTEDPELALEFDEGHHAGGNSATTHDAAGGDAHDHSAEAHAGEGGTEE